MNYLKYILTIFLISCNLSLPAQNLIGYNARDIRQFMKEKHKEMIYENSVNNTFKYLKYTDNDDSSTILFFLSQDSVCRAVSVICDKSLRSEKVREMDETYRKNGVNSWVEMKKGKQYIIELSDADWSFDITIRQVE